MVQPHGYIRSQYKIYGRNTSTTTLTKYQEGINKAAFELCLKNPDLLSDRKALLEASQKRLDESGYIYKKGKSHSKRLSFDDDESSGSKKIKINKEFRTARIKELEEQIKDKNSKFSTKN